ncbi:hypothetical protein CHS0354_033229 [Potamilus streckersoni]|uniref:Uncharacterized protein n=1 Tax=Potamilus streckersoni TaxID=2493646 RepID=A0AAE0VQ48_9BIVA|nr:hypothetical protein CHS0354_033229 [Potamilus streckersoni]
MDRRFQPERYDLWKAGNDIAPHPKLIRQFLLEHGELCVGYHLTICKMVTEEVPPLCVPNINSSLRGKGGLWCHCSE